jgi:hypothetical protein
MDTKVRNKSFDFDKVCTLHITTYAGCLLYHIERSEYAKSSIQKTIETVAKCVLIMEGFLNDGSVSSFGVCDVLHVYK